VRACPRAGGAAITAKILDETERRDLEFGLVTLCVGGGQGIALLLGRESPLAASAAVSSFPDRWTLPRALEFRWRSAQG
jgi:Thiolase, C-terminal domain